MATNHCSTSSSDDDIGAERLADMIYDFGIVDQDGAQGEGRSPCSSIAEDCQIDAEDSNSRDFYALFREQLCQILEDVSSSSSTTFAIEMRLVLDAEKAVALVREAVWSIAVQNVEQNSRSRRFVMKYLRLAGYDAAVCKSRWEKTIGYPAGDYEFIDVVFEGSKFRNERFFVDINFREQFEIARPTDEYNGLLQQLPTLFVGRADKLCEILKVMCNAARRSLREREMCVPPWRKFRYVQFKWLGPYKRTAKPAASRAEQGLHHFPLSGIALKVTGWDVSIVHHIEKGDHNATDKNLRAKSRYRKQFIVQLESPARLFSRGEQHRLVKKISGLATALADAGLTTSSPVL